MSKYNNHTPQQSRTTVIDAQIQTITSHTPTHTTCRQVHRTLSYKDARVHYTVTTTTPHQHQPHHNHDAPMPTAVTTHSTTPQQCDRAVAPKPNSAPKSQPTTDTPQQASTYQHPNGTPASTTCHNDPSQTTTTTTTSRTRRPKQQL